MVEVSPDSLLILNVDDYVPGRYARTKLLRQAGYRVIEAGTGAETLELVERERPALILLDVNLPDSSGFDICGQLRENEFRGRENRKKPGAAPIILHISASSVLLQHQVNGLDSGADGYLVEPIEPALLLATINAYLRARQAEEELRKSNEELRWFAYRAGHDLHEPVRTLTSYAQLMRRRLGSNADPEILQFLEFIESGSRKMGSFVDGLLQYSQATAVEAGAGTIDCEAMLRRVVEALDSAIRESGAKITHDPLPEIVATEQLEHVFQNLIANAIKYHRPGISPEIHVSAAERGNNWVFSVRDNGIGIPDEYRDQVFEVFRRLHGSDIPGNGIGLALARRIAERHGGRIWVESEVDCGSVFFIAIPTDMKRVVSSGA